MKIEDLKKYKKVLILRYGIEGRSIEAFLKKNFPKMKLGLGEEKDEIEHLKRQIDYEMMIKTPGVNKRVVGIPYTTPTNIYFANAKATILGITGTKGKSTTTSLIYEMLKAGGYDARLLGNIGFPMIDALDLPVNNKTVHVLELSSFQLDDIKHSPHISVILNLFPEHMDYHGSFESYKEAKKNILKHAKSSDYFVYNPLYPELVELANKTIAKPIPFADKLPFKTDSISLLGEHNLENIKAAVAVAKIMKVEDKAIEKAVKNFKPLPHRLEFVGEFKGIKFYDDAISTTPESTIQGIRALPNIKTIFLGGLDRGYDFKKLAVKIIDRGIGSIVLFPDSGKKIGEELLKFGVKLNILETRDMEEAVKFAYKNTPKGSICLLSCASPSYSIWKNFEEKGDLFKKFVREHGSNG